MNIYDYLIILVLIVNGIIWYAVGYYKGQNILMKDIERVVDVESSKWLNKNLEKTYNQFVKEKTENNRPPGRCC